MRRDRGAGKKRAIQIFIGLFIAFIMVFSIFEYSMMRDTGTTNKYNGYSFSQDSQTRMFLVKVSDRTYPFYSWPGYLEDIPLDPLAITLIKNAQAAIYTFDPKAPNLPIIEQVRYEFSTILPVQPVFAVTQNDTTYAHLPILTCNDAAPLAPVIFLNVSDNTSITTVGSCIILNANNTEFLRARDRLLYAYLGVMK
jgi:hypothetical protein